jgi:hypothetical protein
MGGVSGGHTETLTVGSSLCFGAITDIFGPLFFKGVPRTPLLFFFFLSGNADTALSFNDLDFGLFDGIYYRLFVCLDLPLFHVFPSSEQFFLEVSQF